MTYEILYHPLVVKQDIPSLGSADRERIKHAIEKKLTTQPEVFSIPLRQSLKGYRKLRVGNYRVILRIKGNTIIIILVIAHRSIVYALADRRHE